MKFFGVYKVLKTGKTGKLLGVAKAKSYKSAARIYAKKGKIRVNRIRVFEVSFEPKKRR